MIKASSGLSDDEIEPMVRDAEAHADEDKKFEALVMARNTADAMIHKREKHCLRLGTKDHAEKAEIGSN